MFAGTWQKRHAPIKGLPKGQRTPGDGLRVAKAIMGRAWASLVIVSPTDVLLFETGSLCPGY